jgi:hypothetical protein
MRLVVFILILVLVPLGFLFSQKKQSIAEVVEENLMHYNQRNIDSFMTSFSDSIALYSFGNEIPIAHGKEKIRDLYAKLFEASPNLHSTIVHRAVIGNKVIDYESIVGRNGKMEPIEMVVIYEIEGHKIEKMTVLKE